LNPKSPFIGQEVLLAQERQKESIPHFSTRQRLSIKLRPTDEKLFIYDTDLNEFFFAFWTHEGTKFTVADGGGGTPPAPSDSTTFTEQIIAGQNLPAFVPILDNGTIANSNDVIRRHRVIGITLEPIGFSASGKYAYAGLVKNPLWSFPSFGNLFLNGSSLSHIKPASGFILNMGKILSPDTIHLNILYSIRL
jgi:hypothetical protein